MRSHATDSHPPTLLLFPAQMTWNAHVVSITASQMVLLLGNAMKHVTSGAAAMWVRAECSSQSVQSTWHCCSSGRTCQRLSRLECIGQSDRCEPPTCWDATQFWKVLLHEMRSQLCWKWTMQTVNNGSTSRVCNMDLIPIWSGTKEKGKVNNNHLVLGGGKTFFHTKKCTASTRLEHDLWSCCWMRWQKKNFFYNPLTNKVHWCTDMVWHSNYSLSQRNAKQKSSQWQPYAKIGTFIKKIFLYIHSIYLFCFSDNKM